MPPRYLCPALWLCLVPIASAQTVELVSVATNGTPADLDSTGALVSADGRFVAFTSRAHLFSPNDPDPSMGPDLDVYLRDRLAGTTTHVSSAFRQAICAGISADGSCVVFHTNSVTSGGVGIGRSMVWERASGSVQPVTTGDLESYADSLSADGRYVAFLGRNMPSGTSYTPLQAWVVDRASGTILLASHTPSGAPGNRAASGISICANGTRVAFTSEADDLVANDTNDSSDVFVFDVTTQSVRRVSVDAQGTQGNFGSLWETISADGRYVGFLSVATNLVAGDTNSSQDLFRCELATGAIERLTVSTGGDQVVGLIDPVKLSGDGRLAFFSSTAAGLTPGDTNQAFDIFVRDTASRTTERLTANIGGIQPNGGSQAFSASPDGRFVAFRSAASNLVPNDGNGETDVFLLDRGPQCFAGNYCTALPNSTGSAASIQAQGVPSFTSNNLVLSASGLPPSTIGNFYFGTSPVDPGVAFGNGLRCVVGSIVRLGVVHASGSTAVQAQDLGSPQYAGVHAGDTRYFQFVYRNQAAGGAGFNTSDATLVTFCP